MVDKDIQIKDCKHMEFGNPSSHTFGSAFMYMTTGYLLVKHYCHKMEMKKRLNVTIVVMNFILFGIYMIGFSRVFKGVHTYNQIVSGAMFGIILAMMQCFVFYDNFFIFYVSIRKRNLMQLVFNQFTIVFVVLCFVGTLVHWDTQKNFKVP